MHMYICIETILNLVCYSRCTKRLVSLNDIREDSVSEAKTSADAFVRA